MVVVAVRALAARRATRSALVLAISVLPPAIARARRAAVRCDPADPAAPLTMLVVTDASSSTTAATTAAAAALHPPACPRSRRARTVLTVDHPAAEALMPRQLVLAVANLITDLHSSLQDQINDLDAKRRQLERAWRRAALSRNDPHLSALRRRRSPRNRDPESVLGDPSRSVAIVTTAALPWMTGTAINPLLRAAYLSRIPTNRDVTLLVPWVPQDDQRALYPRGITFETPSHQEAYMRRWLDARLGFTPNFKIAFYPGRYAPDKGSIFALGDITRYIPDSESDIAILEEPEHLNWYHHGTRWSNKFRYVLGIVHTNYLEYVRREKNSALEAWLRFYNQCVVRPHCNKIIKLSGAVQDLPRSTISYVHGVSPTFLEVGRRMVRCLQPDQPDHSDDTFSKGVYFLGKVIWGKGYSELLNLVQRHCELHGPDSLGADGIDVYGSGDDFDDVTSQSAQMKLPLHFHGPKDHAHTDIHSYKVFINPSLSDVVATTTAEALAMGKFVVVARHPSNEFFSTFPNCLVYDTPDEFSACMRRALLSEPAPMTDELRHRLTWEAATQRLMDATAEPGIARPKHATDKLLDDALYAVQHAMTGMEAVRLFFGAGPNSKDNPDLLTNIDVGKTSHRDRGQFPQAPPRPAASSRHLHLAFLEALSRRREELSGLSGGDEQAGRMSGSTLRDSLAPWTLPMFPWAGRAGSTVTLTRSQDRDDAKP